MSALTPAAGTPSPDSRPPIEFPGLVVSGTVVGIVEPGAVVDVVVGRVELGAVADVVGRRVELGAVMPVLLVAGIVVVGNVNAVVTGVDGRVIVVVGDVGTVVGLLVVVGAVVTDHVIVLDGGVLVEVGGAVVGGAVVGGAVSTASSTAPAGRPRPSNNDKTAIGTTTHNRTIEPTYI